MNVVYLKPFKRLLSRALKMKNLISPRFKIHRNISLQTHTHGLDIPVGQALPDNSKKAAFSLVEMLMALLVASLLLAALAPVMTKRMDEAKINISGVGAAQYDKDSLISIYTGSPDEDKIFNVPSDVNMIKATLIGGGGAGGNSFYGKDEITTSKSWTVPEGVTKLRVFMLGGGGGGASGGLGTGTATIPAGGDGNTYKDFGEGAHEFTIPSTATKVPELNEACAASGVSTWTGVTDGQSYTPGKVAVSVTACGGGGGGGGSRHTNCTSGSGGSGGYVENIQLSGTLSSIYVKVGGGGGGGTINGNQSSGKGGYGGGGGGSASGGNNGSNGGIYGGDGGGSSNFSCSANQECPGNSSSGANGVGILLSVGGNGGNARISGEYHAGNGGGGGLWGGGGGGGGRWTGMSYDAGGGGGGGPTTISTLNKAGNDDSNGSNVIFQVGGGGGGGACNWNSEAYGHISGSAGGGGGGGGGYGAGGGGGGSGKIIGAGGIAAGSFFADIGIKQGKDGLSAVFDGDRTGTGGRGGNGFSNVTNIAGNTNGKIGTDTIWKSSSYCDGGNGSTNGVGSSGKPGALRLYYTYPELKCDFSLPANGSGGGGGGQLVVGEISVTPGETLYFEVGSGGAVQSIAGKNGNNGNPTRIRRGGPSGTVIVEALGGLAGHYSSAETTESQGGTYRTNLAVGEGNTLDNNWTGIKYNLTSGAGSNGKLATALLNKAYGGAGGSSQNMKGEILQGGVGGNSVKNGASPDIKAYGAGGGGGSGSQSEGDSTFGVGAGGASGYIYFEYGGSNGGGGTAGEMITKIITNIKGGTELKINIGEGGDNSTGDGTGKTTSIEYQTSSTKTLSARGGIRGNDGLIKDTHAAEQPLPDNFANKNEASAKGGAGEALHGGIGGYIEHLYENADGTWATYIKAKDGTIGGPVLGGCGGNLTALTGAILCNGTDSAPNGKDGVFGGGGGGGAVINETGGLGGRGGKGMVILEYKAVGL